MLNAGIGTRNFLRGRGESSPALSGILMDTLCPGKFETVGSRNTQYNTGKRNASLTHNRGNGGNKKKTGGENWGGRLTPVNSKGTIPSGAAWQRAYTKIPCIKPKGAKKELKIKKNPSPETGALARRN